MVDSPLGPPAQSQIFLPTVLVSTQRKANVYSILQEVIQQEGELGGRASRGWSPSPPRR